MPDEISLWKALPGGVAAAAGREVARAEPRRPRTCEGAFRSTATGGQRVVEGRRSHHHSSRSRNTDPKLRAEAMRRLGDLNLESGELERMANEVTRLDLPGAEAIKLTTLLRIWHYARNDQVLYQFGEAY